MAAPSIAQTGRLSAACRLDLITNRGWQRTAQQYAEFELMAGWQSLSVACSGTSWRCWDRGISERDDQVQRPPAPPAPALC